MDTAMREIDEVTDLNTRVELWKAKGKDATAVVRERVES
jgi:hypothetical protein